MSVKLRILANVGSHRPGDEVEVSEEQAKHLTARRSRSRGADEVEHFRAAMPVEEYEELKALPPDKGGLTKDEAEALGLPNRVQTPHDPTFEAQLELKRKGLDRAAKAKAAVKKAEEDAQAESEGERVEADKDAADARAKAEADAAAQAEADADAELESDESASADAGKPKKGKHKKSA